MRKLREKFKILELALHKKHHKMVFNRKRNLPISNKQLY